MAHAAAPVEVNSESKPVTAAAVEGSNLSKEDAVMQSLQNEGQQLVPKNSGDGAVHAGIEQNADMDDGNMHAADNESQG